MAVTLIIIGFRLGETCKSGESLFGGQYCVAIYNGEKVGSMERWCDSYEDKDLFIPNTADIYNELQIFLYMNGKTIVVLFGYNF